MSKINSKRKATLIIVLITISMGSAFVSQSSISSAYHPNSIKLTTDISEIDLSKLPDITYEGTSEDNQIEMIIITPPDNPSFVEAVTPLMEWKNEKGVRTIILSNYTEYEGRDGPEKIRNMITYYYEQYNTQWVLLAGDAQDSLIPIRYVFNPDVKRWQPGQHESVGNENYKPTDFYYADLTGSWDTDNDNNFGESADDNANGVDEIDWTPEVYVGRLPANNYFELERMVNKTIKYEKNPQIGNWMNSMLFGGGLSSIDPYEHEKVLNSYIIEHYASSQMNWTRLIQGVNFTNTNFCNQINQGYSTVQFAGHGAPDKYLRTKSITAYTSQDASASTNDHMPSLIYADACSTSCFDANDNNVGESFIKRHKGGAIGHIGALRITWYFDEDTKLEKLNRGNAKLFWKEFFLNEKYQPGKALYDSKVTYIQSDYYDEFQKTYGFNALLNDFERKNILTYCLLGDPEIDIYTDIPKNVSNPFNTKKIYEGQLISLNIKNILNQTVQSARLRIESPDGEYYTVNADKQGNATFRLLPGENKLYRVTITGHNLIPSYFNFTTLPDTSDPEITKVEWTPKNPTLSDNVCFKSKTTDKYSGIENTFLLISTNEFEDYEYLQLTKESDSQKMAECTLSKLDPGNYMFLFVVRDYAGNTVLFHKDQFEFTIFVPLTDYVLIISSIALLSIVTLSVMIIFSGNKSYQTLLEREREMNSL